VPRKKSTHVDDPVAAGRRLRDARVRAGLSQRRLAFPGCSAGYISRLEGGTRIASPRILRELAQRLDVSEEFLATGADAAPTRLLEDAELALRLDDVEDAAKLFQHVLADARDSRERSRAWEGLGQVAFRSGDPGLAIELFERALSLGGEDVVERPTLAENLARAYASRGDHPRAVDILSRCVDANADDPVQFVRFAGLLGAALTDQGNYAEAERVLASALAKGRHVADPYTRARLYWSETRVRHEQGQSEIAARYGRKTLAILRTIEDSYALAHILQTMGHIYLDLEQPDEALEFLREGRELIAATGTPVDIAQFHIEEARAYAALGEPERAMALAQQAVEGLRDANAVDAGRAYALLGEIHADLGDQERARELLEHALELLEPRGPNKYLVQAYRRLADVLKAKGETEAALELLERAVGVQDRVGRPLA
jgi:tetratricopeptide (TPR) repeat protein